MPAEPEQATDMDETFDEPIDDKLKFRTPWTLWEHYESQTSKMDYASSMCKACWFNDLMSFSIAWSTIPHSDLTNIFFDDTKKTVRM